MDATRQALATHQAVIVSAATGTGKGSVVAGLAIRAAQRNRRVLCLAHRDELLSDLVERVRRVPGAPSVGLVKAARNEMLNPIVVASVQSLGAKRLGQLGRFDLVLTDECHHALAPSYGSVYEAIGSVNPGYKHVGFTATPFRTGKKAGETLGLGKVYSGIAYEYGIADAIAAGDLVPPRGFRVSTSVSLDQVRIGADGDFVEADLAQAIDLDARNDLVAAEYLARTPGAPALVFCASIEHSQHMAEAFARAGVKAEAVWGVMGAAKRRELIRRYKERDGIDVLCSRDLIFEGFDAPATMAIYQARPTQSRVVFVQMVGRGLRLFPGKTECQVVSFVDNGAELDLATLADLSNDDPADRTSKPLAVGDEVIRRRHEDWGVGVIRAIEEGDEGEPPLYRVAWPVSRWHAAPVMRPHAIRDIQRKPEEPEEEGETIEVKSRIAGIQTYEVFLLPGSSPKTAPGWYEYQGTWTCSARIAHRPTWTPSGFITPTETRVLHARPDGVGWSLFEITRPDRDDVVEKLGGYPDQHRAMEAAQARLSAVGAKPTPVDADWKTHPATEAQQRALRSWGIRRDTSKMSKGEASALMDAVKAYRLAGKESGNARGVAA